MSLSFTGLNPPSASYLSIPNSSSLYLGTGDYTIQWWQYQTDSNSYPRIFQIGNYSTQKLGVTIEGSGSNYTFYFWAPSALSSFSLTTSQYKNQWVHFAITRTSNIIRIFMNGVMKYSASNYQNITGFSENLSIAQEANPTASSGFGGYIYGFEISNVSKYTSDTTFTPSPNLPPVTGNTILLVSGSGFSGTLGGTVTGYNYTTVSNMPPGANNNPTTPITPLCFLEGTKILVQSEKGEDGYLPIEDIKAGDKVWTYQWGYIPVAKNGYLVLDYQKTNPNKGNRLYSYSTETLDGLLEELVLTGYHSVLVPYFTDKQREETRKLFGKIYITDKLARLAVCLDERAQLYEKEGQYKVYHLALENEDYYTNYGILANGMLTETTSLRMFEEGGFIICSESKDWKEKVKNYPLLDLKKGEYSTHCEWL
jgi:hypothetical protein